MNKILLSVLSVLFFLPALCQQRSDEAMAIWAKAIADMGGGIPPSIFASAVFLILRYRELGHDLDRELAELT